MSATAPSVPFSAVMGTVQGWPEVEPNVRSLEAAAERVGGEVIVVDGSGLPEPPGSAFGSAVRWISEPGMTVFQGRMRGYREARGEIVGITEDHCLAPADWAERMLAGHREHPGAAAVGGAVENGARQRVMDWASFLIVQVAVMAPIPSGATTRLSGPVNVAYKRHALAAIDDNDGMGAMDGLHQAALVRSGELLVADDRIRIVHDQSLGFRHTTTIHYHAGRTMSAFRRQRMGPREWARFVGAFVVPIARFGRIVAIGGRKGYTGQIVRSAPAIVWLLYAQALGQFLGYARGAGGSANQLQ